MDINMVLCPFDNGIRVMQQFQRGVYGAANAPECIFKTMFPKKDSLLEIPLKQYNTGKNEDTYKAHSVITNFMSKIKNPFFVLGGDHSITYPILKGVTKDAQKNEKYGLIYFDAHYDLRPLEGENHDILSSGNSFYRILLDKNLPISGENMVVIGIKKGNSPIFKAMDSFAKMNRMKTFYLDELNKFNYKAVMKKALEIAGNNTKGIYLSFDIDGIESKFAPGVSCPTSDGLHLSWVKEMLKMGQFIGGDIVEASNRQMNFNGQADIYGNQKMKITSKTAAEIINSISFKKL